MDIRDLLLESENLAPDRENPSNYLMSDRIPTKEVKCTEMLVALLW
jgi:hypothetical protein